MAQGTYTPVPHTWSPPLGTMTTSSHHTARQEGLEDGEDDGGRTGLQRRCRPLSSSLCHTAPSTNIPPEGKGRAPAAGSDPETVSTAPSLPSLLTANEGPCPEALQMESHALAPGPQLLNFTPSCHQYY